MRPVYFIKNWQELTDQVQRLIETIRGSRRSDSRKQRAGKHPQEKPKPLQIPRPSKRKGDSPMNVRPLYDRIIVKRSEEEDSIRNGIFIPDSSKEKPQEGEVVAVGRGRRLDDGQIVPLDVKTGDRVLFGKYTGSETKVEGTEYTIMREDDVLAILD
jgi:chaperonin GroES